MNEQRKQVSEQRVLALFNALEQFFVIDSDCVDSLRLTVLRYNNDIVLLVLLVFKCQDHFAIVMDPIKQTS